MADINAFAPYEATTVSIAATTSSGQVALPARATNGQDHIRVYNSGTTTAFIKQGTSSSVVAATTTDVPIPGGGVEIFSCPAGITNVAAIMASSTGTIYFTLGKGI